MRINLGPPLIFFGSCLCNVAATLNMPPASKQMHRTLTGAGTWWMVANDNGEQIYIHAPAPTSLSIGITNIVNTEIYNYEEDNAIVPVILTCVNDHFPAPDATNKPRNSTLLSMDLRLDVQTSQVINETVTAMLRRLEVTMFQKVSEVLCLSSISYAVFPQSRKKTRLLQAISGGMQSYRVVDLTSRKFAIESYCEPEQQNGAVCVSVGSQLKVSITPSIPSDVDTEPVANMIINVIGSMMNGGDFDGARDLGNNILAVRYSPTKTDANIAAATQSQGISASQSQAKVDALGMSSSGIALVVLTLAGTVYAFLIFVRKTGIKEGIEEGIEDPEWVQETHLLNSYSQKLGRRHWTHHATEKTASNTKEKDEDGKTEESDFAPASENLMNVFRLKIGQRKGTGQEIKKTASAKPQDKDGKESESAPILKFIATNNRDAVESISLESDKLSAPAFVAGSERSKKMDWGKKLFCFAPCGSITSDNRVSGEKYVDIDIGNDHPAEILSKDTASPNSTWKEMAYAIIEQRKMRKCEESKTSPNHAVKQKLPPPPPPPPPQTYTAHELLQLANLSHLDSLSILNRSDPFNHWSPGNTPPLPFKTEKPLKKPPTSSFQLSTLAVSDYRGSTSATSEMTLTKEFGNDKYTPSRVHIDLTSSQGTSVRSYSDLSSSPGTTAETNSDMKSSGTTARTLNKMATLKGHSADKFNRCEWVLSESLLGDKYAQEANLSKGTYPPLDEFSTADAIIIDLKRQEIDVPISSKTNR